MNKNDYDNEYDERIANYGRYDWTVLIVIAIALLAIGVVAVARMF